MEGKSSLRRVTKKKGLERKEASKREKICQGEMEMEREWK